jgi:hypothetical protein
MLNAGIRTEAPTVLPLSIHLIYGESAGLLGDAPTVFLLSTHLRNRKLVKISPNCYLFPLLTFSLYGECAGLLRYSQTVLSSLLTFPLYGECAGLLRYSQTVLPATLNPAVVRICPHNVAQHRVLAGPAVLGPRDFLRRGAAAGGSAHKCPEKVRLLAGVHLAAQVQGVMGTDCHGAIRVFQRASRRVWK